MISASYFWAGVVAGVSSIASATAAVSRFVTKSHALSVALGTLTVPTLVFPSLAYWLMTMEADDAPPGMVIRGSLTAVAAMTPIALLASKVTVTLLDRRLLRNDS